MSSHDIQKKIKAYIAKHEKWSTQLKLLRELLLTTELEENIKWGMPSYEIDGKNVLSLAGFKNHYGIWFHNGVFLKDEHKLLSNAQEKTKAMRHMRFESGDKIDERIILEYIQEAIQNQKAGKEYKHAQKEAQKRADMPQILATALNKDAAKKMDNMSTAAYNEYVAYITDAKRETTKSSRIQKIIPLIIAGRRLSDLWKK